mmetsp:Transcript_31841/g.52489  ORF Transcript_31841/g.52489 Transcript_31841/m.52489 type:complete len:303 (-) Transcript_31841:115-1023(-)|eukprot:CAMPEP_0119022388 /NCGR_PEP_ID=MMETSP1176-20130426/27898_1 /TAXON_ID=265551 /ORGANISM="Synedropsis recta cf, Strain CCMP1620" /LENGTH=302 /DNA_ID=CAMNT_0006977231 /DNA_START=43 /DNA_END=951 /DNA_ORIENTATION=-
MSRNKIQTIAAAVDAIAAKSPSRLALTSPFQSSKKLTYQDLSQKTNALATWLNRYGLEKNDYLVSDLPNVTENLLLQIACNRLGVGYGTAKNLESMAKQFPKVKGAVSASTSGFLAGVGLPLPYLSGDFLQDLIESLDNPVGMDEDEEFFDVGDESTPHGYYNSATAYTNQQALTHGMEAVEELKITEDDTLCISITLCHPFGMGSAVCAALQTGACIALPAVGGIQGCGVPSDRASATLQVLESEQCTILFADTHTLKALPEPSSSLSLRNGVVKIGSGSTFLEDTREFGGISLKTIGKKE